MKVVIEIPEDDYKVFVRQRCTDSTPICRLYKAIKNGIVIPNGHGRLIDADNLMEYCLNQKSKTIDCNDIARFGTIIPSDKDAEND